MIGERSGGAKIGAGIRRSGPLGADGAPRLPVVHELQRNV
ncbi:hypothetical protein MB901379_00786 [Mycobacterium basiliense]|uniref:Uncharacterized protein n=1 Tax=Mycobacterium basiliense TaxID=2094119 RepID=A0A447G9Z6_9MYCO|nr:hypothetical protein MB901379_00786 [Mycobacterium basiliense]